MLDSVLVESGTVRILIPPYRPGGVSLGALTKTGLLIGANIEFRTSVVSGFHKKVEFVHELGDFLSAF